MSTICRACLQTVDVASFFYIDTFDNAEITNTVPKDILLLCVPELDLYISDHPGVCGECLTMFETFYNFKSKCLESEDKIQGYLKNNKLKPHSRVDLTCVVYDVTEHLLCTLEEPENNQANVNIQENNEVDFFKKTASSSSQLPPCEDEVLVLSCNNCSFVTMDKNKLTNHKCLSVCTNEKYKCPYCEYCTGRRYRLGYHINAKHSKMVDPSSLKPQTTKVINMSSSMSTNHMSTVNMSSNMSIVNMSPNMGAFNMPPNMSMPPTMSMPPIMSMPPNMSMLPNMGMPPNMHIVDMPPNMRTVNKMKVVNMNFSCNECGFKAASEKAIQKHKVAIHGPIMHVCEVCSYQTKDKSNYRKHLYIHGDKPQKCTKCSYQCVSPYQLERHFKKSHV